MALNFQTLMGFKLGLIDIDVAGIIVVIGFPSFTKTCLLLQTSLIFVLLFVTAVDPVARLLLLLTSLESGCCFLPCC
jgi:hypothetical protein